MRYISIDLSSDSHLEQPQIFGGYAGEHNETILQVVLPPRMIGLEHSGYRFDFQTSEDNKISSPLIPVSELNNNVLSFKLTDQLTIAGKLLFNVVATCLNGDVISSTSKTNMVTLYIGDSPDGNSILPDPNGYKDEILEMIDIKIAEALEDIQTGEGGTVVVDQTFNPESKNAQSGKAVTEALKNHYTKGEIDNLDCVIHVMKDSDSEVSLNSPAGNSYIQVNDSGDTVIHSDNDVNFEGARLMNICEPHEHTDAANKRYVDQAVSDKISKPQIDGSPNTSAIVIHNQGGKIATIYIDDGSVVSKDETRVAKNMIATRDSNGNLYTGEPVDNEDCVNKKYVDDVVSKLSGLKIVVVSTLPGTGDADTLYFVPTNNTSDQNLYDEYIYTDGAWEKIGSAAVEVDLTDYVKNTDYATSSKGGVIKPSGTYALGVNSLGSLMCSVYSAKDYATKTTQCFISKGTLDNVLAEKLGDIESLLGGI